MRTWVAFSGTSMGPVLCDSDNLLVEMGEPRQLQEGDLVVTGPYRIEGKRVWSAHRVLSRNGKWATKADWSPDWDPPAALVGTVVGLRRGRWQITWGEGGQILKKPMGAVSRRVKAGPKGRPWRMCLRVLTFLEWALQLGKRNVRYHAI